MLFLAIIITWLAIQVWGVTSALQYDSWFTYWRQWVSRHGAKHLNEPASVILLLLGPVFVVGLILMVFGGWFFGIFGVLVNIVVLLYSCGRGNYEEQLDGYRYSLNHDDDDSAYRVAEEQYGVLASNLDDLQTGVRRVIGYQAYERWFAVVFWFILLGAPGAIFYRLCQFAVNSSGSSSDVTDRISEYSADDDIDKQQVENGEDECQKRLNIYAEYTHSILGWLDWMPSRLWGFSFALGGDFGAIYTVLKRDFILPISVNTLIERINLAAIYGEPEENEDGTIITNAMGDTPANFCHDRSCVKKELKVMQQLNNRAMSICLFAIAVLVVAI